MCFFIVPVTHGASHTSEQEAKKDPLPNRGERAVNPDSSRVGSECRNTSFMASFVPLGRANPAFEGASNKGEHVKTEDKAPWSYYTSHS